MYKKPGTLFIISAPSGAGKTTVIEKVLSQIDGISRSISYTTRAIRAGERDGVDYFFVSKEKFNKKIENNEFIEWANVHGNYYGTPSRETEQKIETGKDIILNIDVQGACQLRRKIKQSKYIFILPPSIETLKDRLMQRKTDTDEDIAKRLKEAEKEIARKKEFDHIVVNDNLEEAVSLVIDIILSERGKLGVHT